MTKLYGLLPFLLCAPMAAGQAAPRAVARLTWIVKDIDKSVEGWARTGTPVTAARTTSLDRGARKAASKWARVEFANVTADLIQPAAGDGPLAEFARRKGQGVYSVVYAVESEAMLEKEKSRLAAAGAPLLFAVTLEDGRGKMVRCHYFDTQAEGKYVLGLTVEPPAAKAEANGLQVTQYAFVARDLERVSAYWERLGFPAMTYSKPETSELVYRGKPGAFSMRLGWQRHTKVPFEWIQALSGPSTYHEHLDKQGEGFHHLAFNVREMDAAIRQWESWGFPLSMGGAWGEKGKPGSGRFAYHDLQTIGGTEIELLWSYRGESGTQR